MARVELKEKIAYLHGLANGLGVESDDAPQSEVLAGVLDILADLAQHVEAAQVAQSEIADQLEDLSADMEELADEVFGDVDGDLARYEVECPSCGRSFPVTRAALEDDDVDLVCPSCGHVVHSFDAHLDVDEDEDEVTDQT